VPNDHQDHTAAIDGPRIDAQTARAWLDAQLARQGITSPTICSGDTLRKLAALFFAGLDDDPRSSPSRSGELRKDRTQGRAAGERRSDQ
jgi:hypothetical protein